MPGHVEQGASIHWGTPSCIVEPVHSFFNGPPGLDPCSNDASIVNARVEYKLPANDGLKDRWDVEGPGTSVYLNMPFGRCYLRDDRQAVLSAKEWSAGRKRYKDLASAIYRDEDEECISDAYAARFTSSSIIDWVNKAEFEFQQHACEIVMLMPAATDTKHFQQHILLNATAIVLIKGRLKFLGSVLGPAPMATCLVYYGADDEGFQRTCGPLGRYVPISREAILRNAWRIKQEAGDTLPY